MHRRYQGSGNLRALGAFSVLKSPDLALIVSRWEKLLDAVKAGIMPLGAIAPETVCECVHADPRDGVIEAWDLANFLGAWGPCV